jgi:hypothetical protein
MRCPYGCVILECSFGKPGLSNSISWIYNHTSLPYFTGVMVNTPIWQTVPDSHSSRSKPVKPQHDLLKRTLMISHDSGAGQWPPSGIFDIRPFQICQHAVPLTSNGLRLARQR